MSDSRSGIEGPNDLNPSPRAPTLAVLADILSSKVRATLLAWIAPRLDARFSLTELSHAVGAPISSLQHECYKLERLGFLSGRREGLSRRYEVQLEHSLCRPLIALAIAAIGLETLLRESLVVAGDVDLAVIVGPDPTSEGGGLMLILIGNLDLAGLDLAHRRVTLLLGMAPEDIALAYFRTDDWLAHGAPGHPLLRRLAGRPVQPITGAWPTLPDRDNS